MDLHLPPSKHLWPIHYKMPWYEQHLTSLAKDMAFASKTLIDVHHVMFILSAYIIIHIHNSLSLYYVYINKYV